MFLRQKSEGDNPKSSRNQGMYPNNLKMLFLREIKVLEARQRLEALVIPKRQALTRHQALLAPLLHKAQIAFPQQLKTSIFRLIGYITKQFDSLFSSPRLSRVLLAKVLFNRRYNSFTRLAVTIRIMGKTHRLIINIITH